MHAFWACEASATETGISLKPALRVNAYLSLSVMPGPTKAGSGSHLSSSWCVLGLGPRS